MAEPVSLTINGRRVTVAAGTTVAAAICAEGLPSRYSIGGQPRAPLCGMGVCFECRATVNGRRHVRTCQVACAEGMEVVGDD